MFNRTYTYHNINNNDDIIVAIVTNNLTKLKKILNQTNVNNIIDNKNNYNALHYAVTLPNNDITKYILDLGANPKIKQNEGFDAYELGLRSGKKFIFEYFEKEHIIKIDKLETEHKMKIDKLETENTILCIKNDDLKKNNEFLSESFDAFNNKINSLYEIIEVKDNDINKLKRDLEESEKAFINVLKKNKK
jgi:ankyrin repeat protein